jgi:hypothetical protein
MRADWQVAIRRACVGTIFHVEFMLAERVGIEPELIAG